MRSPANPRIQAWFDSGEAVEALIGDDDHRVRSDDNEGAQDRILVVAELLAWAATNGRVNEAARSLTAAIEREVADGRPDDALDIAWCYFVMRDETGERLPIDSERLASLLSGVDPATIDQAMAALVISRLTG